MQMPIFVLFVSARVLFDDAFSLLLSLSNLHDFLAQAIGAILYTSKKDKFFSMISVTFVKY